MKVIIEIDDDLVQAHIIEMTQDKKHREEREALKSYFQEHREIEIPEEALSEIDESFPTVMALLAIEQACKEMTI